MADEIQVQDQVQKPKRIWALVVLGILSIIVGIMVTTQPLAGVLWITILTGAMFCVDGIVEIIDYVKYRKTMDVPVSVLVFAIISIVLGALIMSRPLAGVAAIVTVSAIAFLVSGAWCLYSGFKSKKNGERGWGWMLVVGIIDVIVGLGIFFNPALLALFVGISLAMHGILCIFIGMQKH